jgi:hypothetical protein
VFKKIQYQYQADMKRLNSSIGLVLSAYSISTGAQYVTPDSTIYCEKVKMCRFSSGNWFFCTKICAAYGGCAPPKKKV